MHSTHSANKLYKIIFKTNHIALHAKYFFVVMSLYLTFVYVFISGSANKGTSMDRMQKSGQK